MSQSPKPPTHAAKEEDLMYINVVEDEAPIQAVEDPVFLEGLQYKRAVDGGPLLQQNKSRYARFHITGALQFMGCKSADAVEITEAIFHKLKNPKKLPDSELIASTTSNKVRTSVTLKRSQFTSVVKWALAKFGRGGSAGRNFTIAMEVQDRKHSFTILLGGTSGCGKSTLTSLLASRVGFTSVVSTDNIRQVMRSFISQQESPVLWASTYHAGETLPHDPNLSYKKTILKGYEAQSRQVFSHLDNIISQAEARKESLIVEGVHLATDLVVELMEKHPTCIPFLIYISNEAKHKERFAIRAKYMTLDPLQNKYTKYLKNIRLIQDNLCKGADKHLIPKIDNTNIDRSLATIHATLFNCLPRLLSGERFFDPVKQTAWVVHQEYMNIQQAFWESKGMLELKRKKQAGGDDEHHLTLQDLSELNLTEEDLKEIVGESKPLKSNDQEDKDEDQDSDSAYEYDEVECGSIGS